MPWKLKIRPKSDLLKSIEKLSTNPEGTAPVAEVLLIDGAALVTMPKRNGVCKTFSEFSVSHFDKTKEMYRVKPFFFCNDFHNIAEPVEHPLFVNLFFNRY